MTGSFREAQQTIYDGGQAGWNMTECVESHTVAYELASMFKFQNSVIQIHHEVSSVMNEMRTDSNKLQWSIYN